MPKMTNETQYWLEIIVALNWLTKEQIKHDYDECAELLALFTAIGKKVS